MTAGLEIENICGAIDSMAETRPNSEFLINPETGKSVTFHELKERSILVSRILRDAGLNRGEKVALLMDNGLLTAELFLGAMYGGYVSVPLNVRAGAAHLSYMLDHCDAAVVFVEHQYTGLLHETVGNVRRDVRIIEVGANGPLPVPLSLSPADSEISQPAPNDVALLMYSSGSTGKPKAAIHTHSSILAHGRNSIEAHQLSSKDRSLLVLPLYHINAECVTLIPTLLSGGLVVIAHRFSVSKFWDWIDDFCVTWSALVPTIISELVDWDDPGKERRQAAFQRIRFFRSSSAPLSPTLHRQFLNKFNLPLLQAMGSTEGGNVFSNPVPPGKNKIGSPGLPWGFEARIVNREGADTPDGEPGEVLLRGAGMMRGYYKDPEETGAVLDRDGWLHTGDLARRDEDGYFFIVGRSKELIIKGGVNIAPRQIDEILESHPAVMEAAAVGVPDRYFGEDAVAFVVLRREATADEKELLAFCETRLGHFKTPSRIHFLKELPKGPSGKVQRLRLLDPAVLSNFVVATQLASEAATIDSGRRKNEITLSSTNSIEEIVAEAWAEVLALPQVGLETNFFALGGHSLLAIQCLSKLREKLPIVLSLADFFANSTVAEQAELIRSRMRSANGTDGVGLTAQPANWEQTLLRQYVPTVEETIPHVDSELPHPLSPAQQRLWFMWQLNPAAPVYNESEAVLLAGDLDVGALEKSLNNIITRHEVLRSTITVIDGVPHAVVHRDWPLRIKRIDLSTMSPTKLQSEVDCLLIDEPRAPYDLEAKPGIRVTLLHLGARDHVLILMMHHIICDWSSEGTIWRELSALYRSYLTGRPAMLPALTVTNRDYAAWQEQRLTTTQLEEGLTFWETTLHGAPPLLELPADRVRPRVMSYNGGRIRWKLDSELTEALRTTSRQERTSLFTIFAAALDILLYRYTGVEDILLGIPLADRDQRELQSVVGFLLHVHVLRTRLSGEMTFRDLLGQVQKGTLDLYSHREIPFEQIVRKLQPERNLSYSPLFQVMLNWRDRDQSLPFIGLDGLGVESLMSSAGTSKFDLYFFATDNGDDIWLELEYSTDLFDADRVTQMLGHYQTLLEGAATDPSTAIAKIPLLTAKEYKEIVVDCNHTERAYPQGRCFDKLIDEQVERTPDAIAISFGADQLTYRELADRADELAAYLQKLGVSPNSLVAICVERSLEMVIGLLGIAKAGGAYLPLDPAFPQDRLALIMSDAQPVTVLTLQRLRDLLPPHSGSVVCLDALPAMPYRQPVDSTGRSAEDLAYVLYTSGSTGTPKGVQIQHHALVNFLTSMQLEPGIAANDVLLAITTLSFDIAGLELFLPLTVGARVVIASSETAKDGNRLSTLMESSRTTIMQATPATWRMLLDSGWRGNTELNILCGGEPWGLELSGELLPRCKSLWNMYGPTETTVWSAVSRVEKDQPVLIGRPIANTTFLILDKWAQPAPVGIPGELHIGGRGLALGYLGRDKLTNERFIPDWFHSEAGARLYKTGDLVRRVASGSIEFLRRLDDQVKLRGFRIELGEIEARLSEYPGVRDAVVIVREDVPGDKTLVAYYTYSKDDRIPAEQLRSHFIKFLPEYMVPAASVRLECLPLTLNGKLDRKALPAPDANAYRRALMLSNSPSISSGDVVEMPRDTIEAKLLQIWEELLQARPIGIRSNFFNVGGHSLLVVKLFARINKVFDRSLPVGVIFASPTIEQLATLIRGLTVDSVAATVEISESLAKVSSSVVPIQPIGSAPPLFLIHGWFGHIIGFHELAMLTGTDHPMYGIQAQSLLPGQPALLRLEDQAAYYLSEIRKIQPKGPYYLLGYCFGGVVAFEIAHQLHELGERVELLGLLEAFQREHVPPIQWDDSPPRDASLRIRFSHRMARFRTNIGPLSLRNKIGYIPERLLARIFYRICDAAPSLGWRCVPSFMKDTKDINMLASRKYRPRIWPGTVTLFRATIQRDPRMPRDLGWSPVVMGGVEVLDVPGDHFSLLGEPHIQVLAEQLRKRLERSDTAAPELLGSACTES
jgi:amino acid adenylation domain-containing protein